MVTPIMISGIGWGTYLFFACVNACFFPIIYFFYPETARRSLEEIDLIFAKGYVENMSYVRAAKELPYLSDEDIERVAIQYGLTPGEGEVKPSDAIYQEEFAASRLEDQAERDAEKVTVSQKD
jgi:hypothetical protein